MRRRGGGGGGRWVDEPQLLGLDRRRSLRLTRGPAFGRGGLRLGGALRLLGASLLGLLRVHDLIVALPRLGRRPLLAARLVLVVAFGGRLCLEREGGKEYGGLDGETEGREGWKGGGGCV